MGGVVNIYIYKMAIKGKDQDAPDKQKLREVQ